VVVVLVIFREKTQMMRTTRLWIAVGAVVAALVSAGGGYRLVLAGLSEKDPPQTRGVFFPI
jgi:hypothetical protein